MNLVFSKVILILILSLAHSSITQSETKPDEEVEVLKYRLSIGWFTIGSGQVTIRDKFSYQGKPCYKVETYTETLGLGNWLGSLDDHYTSFIEKENLKPVYNEKHVTSQNNTWDQWSTFDYDKMMVDVKVMDNKLEVPERAWQVELEQNTQDVLGTFIFFKHYNWINIPKGDSVMLTTFYEKKLYRLGVRYMGQEIIEFNDRSVGVYRLHLLMPEHENIKKERPIIIWVTSDKNQYPLRIQTRLPFLGKAKVELIELNGDDPIF